MLPAGRHNTQMPQRVKDNVGRIIERRGGDPGDDEDYQRMLVNPARHAFGWDDVPNNWPWDRSWKPSADPIRNLGRARALSAAEIDRLTRAGR